MGNAQIVDTFFLIFTGAALIATLALYARQALLVAYILLGILAGPHVTGLVTDPSIIQQMSHVGIIFLLFLLGLDLEPRELQRMLRKVSVVTLASSLVFAAIGFSIAFGFGYTLTEAVIIGAAMMFSSTILGLKLLPTTALHHQHAGEVMIAVLLLQDLIAIAVLIVIQGASGHTGNMAMDLVKLMVGVPLFMLGAYLFARYVLHTLIQKFDQIREYIFLLAIGWCLGTAEAAAWFGLSEEIGAFIGGIALATSPIARFIAESLRPLRDFFLILFFFSLGAGVDLGVAGQVLLPAVLLALVMQLAKPLVFRRLLCRAGEEERLAREMGARLGQISEFSLLIAVLAVSSGVIGSEASYLIQIATVISFMISSYYIVMRYPTPIAVSDSLRQD